VHRSGAVLTMPPRQGLSSSAAICVLVARAFNRLYDLKMTVRLLIHRAAHRAKSHIAARLLRAT
jgi:mevalonate kinase